jgi:hypothetical protein
LAISPASRWASISLISSIDPSILLVGHRLDAAGMLDFHFPRGTSRAHIFMYAAGCSFLTFAMTCAPPSWKSFANASRDAF